MDEYLSCLGTLLPNPIKVQCITVKIGFYLRNPSSLIDFHKVVEVGPTYHLLQRPGHTNGWPLLEG